MGRLVKVHLQSLRKGEYISLSTAVAALIKKGVYLMEIQWHPKSLLLITLKINLFIREQVKGIYTSGKEIHV
jgi:hypothetical protein